MDIIHKFINFSRSNRDHYLFMYTYANWEQNPPYIYKFDALPHELSNKIATAIFEECPKLESIQTIIDLLKHYKHLDPSDSLKIITSELDDELKTTPLQIPKLFTKEQLIKILDMLALEDDGLLNTFAAGPFSFNSETILIKDNDRVWDQFKKAGMPSSYEKYII